MLFCALCRFYEVLICAAVFFMLLPVLARMHLQNRALVIVGFCPGKKKVSVKKERKYTTYKRLRIFDFRLEFQQYLKCTITLKGEINIDPL